MIRQTAPASRVIPGIPAPSMAKVRQSTLPGTYTIHVVSKLNNMHNNYKNGGQLYVGKTVSEKVTFTLV